MTWNEEDWKSLLRLIRRKQCTPFLGAGASAPTLPTGRQLAKKLVQEFKYPFQDETDLTRVAQWTLGRVSEIDLKGTVAAWLKEAGSVDARDAAEPHRVLASLGLPIYITTNFDDFMTRALSRQERKPRREVCQWHRARRRQRVPRFPKDYEPTRENPLVFHLHGTLDEPIGMVLTEDDYLDFLIYVDALIPPCVEQAFSDSCILFLGYSLNDMSLKVLFRKLASYHSRGGWTHLAVQLDPADEEEPGADLERKREYLEDQYRLRGIRVFWGSSKAFAAQLLERWEALPHD